MKKFVKALATICVLVMAFSLTACTTYTKNGSVIQDVKFDVTYTVDGETTTVNSTLSLYKTFAPKTCDRIIGQYGSYPFKATRLYSCWRF